MHISGKINKCSSLHINLKVHEKSWKFYWNWNRHESLQISKLQGDLITGSLTKRWFDTYSAHLKRWVCQFCSLFFVILSTQNHFSLLICTCQSAEDSLIMFFSGNCFVCKECTWVMLVFPCQKGRGIYIHSTGWYLHILIRGNYWNYLLFFTLQFFYPNTPNLQPTVLNTLCSVIFLLLK